MKASELAPWLLLAIGGYVLYRVTSKAADTGKKAVDWTSSQIANLWLTMFPLPPSMELLGNIIFPGNIKVPLQQLAGQVRQDRDGNTFVNYAGMYWQLSPSDANGNWPATPIPEG